LQTATDSLEEYVASFFSTLQMETTCFSNMDFMIALSPTASSDKYFKITNKQKPSPPPRMKGQF
jgi:hypothetical protein